MAVTEDASTPAVAATAGGSAATSLTSASFSPPANSLLVAICLANWSTYPGSVPGFTVTDSASGTWTNGPTVTLAAAFAKAVISTRPVTSAPGSITVTLSRGADNSAAMLMLAARVCAGAKSSSYTGASGTNSGTGSGGTANVAVTITPGAAGSMVYACTDYANNNTDTALASTTTIQSTSDGPDGGFLSAGSAAGPALTSTAFGWSVTLGGGDGWVAAALEILAAPVTAPAGLMAAFPW